MKNFNKSDYCFYHIYMSSRDGRDHMVVGFTTICASSVRGILPQNEVYSNLFKSLVEGHVPPLTAGGLE